MFAHADLTQYVQNVKLPLLQLFQHAIGKQENISVLFQLFHNAVQLLCKLVQLSVYDCGKYRHAVLVQPIRNFFIVIQKNHADNRFAVRKPAFQRVLRCHVCQRQRQHCADCAVFLRYIAVFKPCLIKFPADFQFYPSALALLLHNLLQSTLHLLPFRKHLREFLVAHQQMPAHIQHGIGKRQVFRDRKIFSEHIGIHKGAVLLPLFPLRAFP